VPDLPERRQTGSRRAAGLAVRTTNAAEAEPSTAQIPGLWHRFTAEDWFARLEGLGAVGPTLGVYSDYETDVTGPYRLLVGREFTAAGDLPQGLAAVDIPAGEHIVFRCVGPLPGAVLAGWRDVWAFFAEPCAPRRAYTADLEIYGVAGAAAEIWVSVRRADSIVA
jgi:predicted transcriptional regulator YdeE